MAAAISAGIIYASVQSPDQPLAVESTEIVSDEETLSPSLAALNAMTEEYKTLKELQYEGEEEATFYPKVMEMYLTAAKRLNLQRMKSNNYK